MNKCLRITLTVEPKAAFLQNVVQKYARKFELEGLAQPMGSDKVRIIVCGEKELVDDFIDIIHKESPKADVQDIEIEPFLKDKDYRGVFRVIE
jgi:acylphosphatase